MKKKRRSVYRDEHIERSQHTRKIPDNRIEY